MAVILVYQLMFHPVPLTILKSMYTSTSRTLTPLVVMAKTNRLSLVSDVMMSLTASSILTKVAWFFCICLPVNQVVRLISHCVMRGAYRVIRRLSDVLYKISYQVTGAVTTAHVQRLQQYLPLEPPVAAPSPPILSHDDSSSDMESISSPEIAIRLATVLREGRIVECT